MGLPLSVIRALSQSAAVRVRPSALSAQGAKNLDTFAKAVGTMSQRSESDPLSWKRQRVIHSMQSTLRMHRCWRFFPWHRLQGVCMEAIVAHLTDTPDFAMPYWSPREHKTIPSIFFDRKSPLYHARNPDIDAHTDCAKVLDDMTDQRGWPMPSRLDSDFSAFHGGPGDGHGGNVDDHTHGAVHVIVGGPNGDMSFPPVATLDPMFWLHHANIDRVWASWQRRPGAIQPSQYPSAFMAERMEQELGLPNALLGELTTADLLNSERLPVPEVKMLDPSKGTFSAPYSYDKYYTLPSFAPPPVPQGWDRTAERTGVSRSTGSDIGTLTKPAIVNIPVLEEFRHGITGNKMLFLDDCRAELHLAADGLDVFNLRIYVDSGKGENLSTSDSSRYCDYLSPFLGSPSSMPGMDMRDNVFLVDVSKQVRAAFERGARDSVNVIVQPVSKFNGRMPSASISVAGASLTSTIVELNRT